MEVGAECGEIWSFATVAGLDGQGCQRAEYPWSFEALGGAGDSPLAFLAHADERVAARERGGLERERLASLSRTNPTRRPADGDAP